MNVPFFFGPNEEEHYHTLANMAHATLGVRPLKVLAVGCFQGAYWHKYFPQDLLFSVEGTAFNETRVQPSYVTELSLEFCHTRNRDSLFVSNEAFDVIVCQYAALSNHCLYKEIEDVLAIGGVIIAVESLITSPRSDIAYVSTNEWIKSPSSIPFSFDWYKKVNRFKVLQYSLLPLRAYTAAPGIDIRHRAPIILVTQKVEEKHDSGRESEREGEAVAGPQ